MDWKEFVKDHEGSPHVCKINGLRRLVVEDALEMM